jgi:hypothetical protein
LGIDLDIPQCGTQFHIADKIPRYGEKLVEHWGFIEKVPPPESRRTTTACFKRARATAPTPPRKPAAGDHECFLEVGERVKMTKVLASAYPKRRGPL